jgi:hypothetical protein
VANAPRLLSEPQPPPQVRPAPAPRPAPALDFTIRATPVFATVVEPVTAPVLEVSFKPAPVPAAPPKRRARLEMASHAPGLSQLRDRLDGLRGELTSLGDALGTRSQKIRRRSGDSG